MAKSISEALKSISAYPIPLRTLVETAESRGLDLYDEATQEKLKSKACRLARADLLLWLSVAPNISQGGQSYSFTAEERRQMRQQAQSLYDELEPQTTTGLASYGYKGDRL